MNSKLQEKVRGNAIKSVVRAVAMFLAVGIAVTPSVFAKPKAKKTVGSNLGVIAHVQLDGGTATRMLLVQKDGKQYLYVGLSSSSGVCIFDVTKPGDPHKVTKFAGVGAMQAADFQLVGDTMAVTSRTGEATAISTNAAPQSVTILNMTDPSNPQQIQTFTDVTSVVADDARGLIYLSNSEGLWVVQARQPEKADLATSYGG